MSDTRGLQGSNDRINWVKIPHVGSARNAVRWVRETPTAEDPSPVVIDNHPAAVALVEERWHIGPDGKPDFHEVSTMSDEKTAIHALVFIDSKGIAACGTNIEGKVRIGAVTCEACLAKMRDEDRDP